MQRSSNNFTLKPASCHKNKKKERKEFLVSRLKNPKKYWFKSDLNIDFHPFFSISISFYSWHNKRVGKKVV